MKVALFAKVRDMGPRCQLEFIKERLAQSAFTAVMRFLSNCVSPGWVRPTSEACGWLQGSLS